MKALLRTLMAVTLLILVWRSVDGAAALALLRQADAWPMLLALGLLSGQIALSALRWSLTAAALGQPLPWRVAVAEYHLGLLLNLTLPGGVLGDAGRAVRTRGSVGVAASAQAVVVERLSGQIAMAALLGAGLALWPAAAPWGPLVAGGGLLALVALGLLLAAGPPLLRRFGRALARVWRPGAPFVVQAGINAAIIGCTIGAMAACSAAVGAPLGVVALVAVPLTLTAMLLPVSVGGWGLREGAAAVVWPMAGHAAQAGVAASVAFGVLALVASLPGLIVAARSGGLRPVSARP